MDLQPTVSFRWAGTTSRDVRHVRDAVGSKVPTSVADDVRLLVSELASNALLHGGGWFLVDVQLTDGVFEVGVTDRDPHLPVALDPSAMSVTGRGLRIVDAIADSWSVEPTPPGKRMWFRLDVDRKNSQS